MASSFKKIREIRSNIFNLITQIAYKSSIDDINKKYALDKDWDTIKDRICYSMGLQKIIEESKQITDFEISKALNVERITEPTITIIDGICKNKGESDCHCSENCLVDAIIIDEHGKVSIDDEKCLRCGLCVTSCPQGAITDKTEIVQVIKLIKENPGKVIAILAPAFVGQFGEDATPEKIKTALKKFGFFEVLEVALAADIITIKEAEIFKNSMEQGQNIMITSCCCPSFVKLVEKYKGEVAHLISDSVSPMVALGRLLKTQDPSFKVVFIGPCIAKKTEALKPEFINDIDAVLTFEELQPMLEALNIFWEEIDDSQLDDASHDGRIFARIHGVSEAISRSVEKLYPHVQLRSIQGNGLGECIKLLKQIEKNELDANFMEGMACPGGCIGGPGTLIPEAYAIDILNKFAERATTFESFNNNKASYIAENYGCYVHLTSSKTNDPIIHA